MLPLDRGTERCMFSTEVLPVDQPDTTLHVTQSDLPGIAASYGDRV